MARRFSSSLIKTTSGSLTVNENSGLTSIGIQGPTDTIYFPDRLAITVTALPTDGTIYLADGVTKIYIGEVLTVAQLTTLLFKPTSGLFGTSSTFTYKVTDPSGTSATGSATLSIAPDSVPPVTTATSLTVAENALATSIGIAAPTDPNYSGSQLKVTVTGLPTPGTVLLSDGLTAVSSGETLTVAQLTGLMFKPKAGTFGTSSRFTYKVTDPSGLSTTGTASLAVGPDTMPPVTTPATLTVAGNSAAAAIGIAAPTDPNYSATQLSVLVTGLPTDGTVLLSDGVTTVANGETLTIAQLTGLMFKPAAGAFGTSSTFTYKVTDPSGLSSSGTATLALGPDTMPPVTTPATLTVAGNSAAAAIGIAAPTDPNYSAAQLSVLVTGLPTDGTVLLSDGATTVANGETLTIAQLTGLMFKPTAGTFGTSSTFTYKVTDPSGLSTTGTASLAVGPDTMPPVTTPAALTVAGNSAAAVIGIAAPTDPNYSATQLSVLVTGLPADGTVLLSDGATTVANGETLTIAQLTGLMFKPAAGAFGTSSTFTYKVTDPSGLSTLGTATLSITADTAPPVTTDPTLTVAPNSGPTPISIPAPTDPNYSSSQLTVLVTGLPGDGTILLSDGVTALSSGQTLSVAQLTGLMFKPTVGLQGQSSAFTYTVTDPAGLTATGAETLAISASSTGSLSADGSTLMAGSGGSLVTAAGTWTFNTGLNNGGYAISLNGIQVGASPGTLELEVAQNGNMFAYNGGSAWYEWTNNQTWVASNPISSNNNSPSYSPIPPVLQAFQQASVARFELQNTQTTNLAAHEISFNEVFALGQVPKASQLYAVINGVQYAVQLDVKTSYADGSVESGIVTLDAPAIAGGTTLQGQLFLGSGAAASAVSIANLPGSGYNFIVNLTMHNSNGTTTPYQLNAGTWLQQALQAGKVSYWLQGPQTTEVRFDVPISGSFHVTFDITDFADGTTRTDVQFNNDYAEQAVGGQVTYDETITQNGSTVSQYTSLTQYQYQTRQEVFWSNGAPQINIVHDIGALEKTGAVPGYNLAYNLNLIAGDSAGMTLANLASLMASSGWGAALPVDGVDQYMPDPGGRPDIGPTTGPSALWLMTQDQTAAQYALGWADVSGSVPWHFYDPTTGNYLSVDQYPQLWTDPRGGNGPPGGLTQQIDMTNSGWTP
ncbi:MAG TPA: hypothetical protein VFR68_14925, partial [Candidatus Dormibacteraeota bacterium]|nr:hypothetical protein [Candidatus Dormibacteraeota bacterium]